MNAEQYRALVNKLEAIQEAEVAAFQNPQGVNPPADAAAPVGSVAADPTATPAPVPAETPAPTTPAQNTNQIPTIEAATFSQAYAQAKKQGLKKFKWCGVYAVKDKPPVNPMPAPSTVQPRFLSQGPSDAIMKDKYGRPIPKASQDLIRQSYDDSTAGV